MRVLLTGSSGNIGREIARQLITAGHTVIGLDVAAGEHTHYQGTVTDGPLIFTAAKEADAIIHTASLHAPHVNRDSKEAFIDVNIKGTLRLLEAAVEYQHTRFVYTSTTSVYGFALVPADGRAVWVTENSAPQPRDIYDITKLAAEQLCQHFALIANLPVICLRTSRFWNEPENFKTFYRLYRGVDVRDAAAAHVLALNHAEIPFDIFNISAQSPFGENDREALFHDAPSVIRRYYPEMESFFAARGWQIPQSIDRIYVIEKARQLLGYQPAYNFRELIQSQSGNL